MIAEEEGTIEFLLAKGRQFGALSADYAFKKVVEKASRGQVSWTPQDVEAAAKRDLAAARVPDSADDVRREMMTIWRKAYRQRVRKLLDAAATLQALGLTISGPVAKFFWPVGGAGRNATQLCFWLYEPTLGREDR